MCYTATGQIKWAALCPPECYMYLSTLDAMRKIYRQVIQRLEFVIEMGVHDRKVCVFFGEEQERGC